MRIPAHLRSRLLRVAAAILLTSTAAAVTAFVLWRMGYVEDTTFWGGLIASSVLSWISNLLFVATAVFRGPGPWHSSDSLYSAQDERRAEPAE